MRLRHKAHGVIANVDDETAELLLAGPWEHADAAPKRRTGQRAKPAEDSDD
ncbi:head-tail connector protein [Gordonia phage Lucky10]|uniref:Head-to-tail connector protein n=1 Tax=Gordonia phage Lucky10 TaxID=1821557 RepID=A0A142KAW7_9CAUD|nr:head-tail connector protein [Gordonia phage Lucky10]AMS03250.1 hypothetical protein SEA_LUCKY10_7 [Gordonia phage Lucky10]